MSSEYEKKSQQQLKDIARAHTNTASRVEPCVAVTEPNWRAMIASQNTQIEMLSEIMTGLKPLATEEDIVNYMNEQMDILREYTKESKQITEKFQSTMTKTAADSITQINLAVKDTEIRVGSMKEVFSDSLSSEREAMKEYTKKLFRISMIPSVLLIALELIPRIWSLISQIF